MPGGDRDCFTEDNTIPQPFRSWRIPGSGDRFYKLPRPRIDFNKLPHAEALKKFRKKDSLIKGLKRSTNPLNLRFKTISIMYIIPI